MGLIDMVRAQPVTTAQFLLQRGVTHPKVREAISSCVALTRPRPAALQLAPEAAERAAALEAEGYCLLPDLVGPTRAAVLRTHFAHFMVRDPYNAAHGLFRPEAAPAGVHVAFYDHAAVASAPEVLAIANDPTLISIVGAALGAKPLITYLAAWWSFPHEGGAIQAENFHRDVDDWRFIKLFVYLTDVGPEAGPHVYVPGSHRAARLTRIQRYPDEAVAAAFGPDALRLFIGPAGTAFLENTFGLHKGTPPTSAGRLILQAVYGLSRMPYGPLHPVGRRDELSGGAALDAYTNRIYLR
jgi:hypothetical protein